jgi:hypothetical protein
MKRSLVKRHSLVVPVGALAIAREGCVTVDDKV